MPPGGPLRGGGFGWRRLVVAGGVVTSASPVGKTSTHSASWYSGAGGVVPGEVEVVAAAVAGVAVVADPAEGRTGLVLDRLGPVGEAGDRRASCASHFALPPFSGTMSTARPL